MIFCLYTPVPSVNYCDGLGRCFRFVCIYACAAVFLCCYLFSVNKDLYIVGTRPSKVSMVEVETTAQLGSVRAICIYKPCTYLGRVNPTNAEYYPLRTSLPPEITVV